jgi:phosphoribosylanthranilate isomerase
MYFSTKVKSGTGETVNWQTAAAVAARGRLVLAGGLNPDNVANAIISVRPFGVDVSSGVEHEPGRKSPELIQNFIQAVRAAEQDL